MKEIGGYIELDTYRLPMLHEGAIALNCGRNALAYLLRARGIRRLWLPKLICSSVINVCEREDVPVSFYGIGCDLLPAEEIRLGESDWFYFVNYYSQFDNTVISEYVKKYGRIIVDNAQSYFQPPIPGVDTIYTCRKWFGVADGAFLYTEAVPDEPLPADESFDRMRFLLGRYERPASEFYAEYTANNKAFDAEPIKTMSKLTENLLHGIDYERVKAVREENYAYLHEALKAHNLLPAAAEGTFMYPLLLESGAEIRTRLQQQKIYIPTLWPNVLTSCLPQDTEYRLAERILPLPIDQRYGREEMTELIRAISESDEKSKKQTGVRA